MTAAAETLRLFLVEAWGALAGGLVILGMLALLVQALRAAGAVVIGARHNLADAAAAAAGFLVILLFGLMGVPELAGAVKVTATGCAPLADLGSAAAVIIGAVAGMRMLLSIVRAAAAAAVGGNGIAPALAEAAESMLGMVLASAAGPLAAHFLGIC